MSDYWLGVLTIPAFAVGLLLPFGAWAIFKYLRNEYRYHRAVREARREDAAYAARTVREDPRLTPADLNEQWHQVRNNPSMRKP